MLGFWCVNKYMFHVTCNCCSSIRKSHLSNTCVYHQAAAKDIALFLLIFLVEMLTKWLFEVSSVILEGRSKRYPHETLVVFEKMVVQWIVL